MNQSEDARVRAEEAAAAAEAGAIGGADPYEDVAPEDVAVVEGGGGEAEGFELAEADLIERAEQGEGGYTGAEAMTPEREADLSTASYGEPDEVDPSEVVEDPETGPDDPGEGPGIARER